MKKLFALMLVALILCGCGSNYTYTGEEPEFRNTEWGMTQDELIELEGNENIVERNDTTLTYYNKKIEYVDLEGFIEYTFDSDGKLIEAQYYYIPLEPKQDTSEAVNQAKKLWRNLNKMYKEPMKVSGTLPDSLSLNDSCNYTAWWVSEKTKVGYVLLKESGSQAVSFSVTYKKK